MKPDKFTAYTIACLVIVGFVYASEEPPNSPIVLTKCEGETAKLSCPNGTVISIELANYGRFSVSPCNPEADPTLSTSCLNDKTLAILQERCDTRDHCAFNVSNLIFGDSCPETSKYLEARYMCVPAPATTTTTTTTSIPKTTTVTVKKDIMKSGMNSELDDILVKTTSTPKSCKKVFERHLEWPETEIGNLARVNCPAGTTGYAEWFCSEFGEWTPKTGADLSRCVSDWVEKLLKDVIDEHDELIIQLETLKEIHSHSRRQTLIGGELIKIKFIVEKVVENYLSIMKSASSSTDERKTGYKMNKFWIESINHLLGDNQKGAWFDLYPKKQREIASSFINSAEKLLSAMFPIVISNFHELDSENIVAKPNVIAQVSTVRIEDYVTFPSVPIDNDIVHVPREALEASGRVNAQVVYANYHGLEEYLKPLEDYTTGKKLKKLVSRIISVNLVTNGKPQVITRIARPIVLEFETDVGSKYENPQCVWWDKTQLEWSTNGCKVRNFNGTHTTCECDHMTHFGVLMDMVETEEHSVRDEVLMLVTYIGCCISGFCLIMAFLCFSIFGESGCERTCILKNLTITLAIAEVVFLYGIEKTEYRTTCWMIAGLLHYFLLSSFIWMFLEGFQLYSLLVQVGPSEKSKKPYLYLIGYGIPTVIVGCCFYFFSDNYGTRNYCFLIPSKFLIWSFVGPVAIILFLNLVFLIMTLCGVCRHSNGGYKPCAHDRNTVKVVRNWLKLSFCMVFLKGLTWTFGFLWINEKIAWTAYIFTGFNGFLGFFILLFYVIVSEKMHKDFENWTRRNNWLPDCFGNSRSETRTGPYLSSTATSTAHCGTSSTSHGSEGMTPPPRIRKLRERNYYSMERKSKVIQQEMLLTGQCPNCSHSTTILYSAPHTLRGTVECGREEQEISYTMTPTEQKPMLASVNFPGSQQWALDKFGQLRSVTPASMDNRLYNGSMREAMASNYQRRIHDEVYDYATIPYDSDDRRSVYPTSRMQLDGFRTCGSDYRSMSNCQSPMNRPPPKFKPPPPPQISSLPLSDDSAYSDSGGSSSRSPNSGVSRSGTMLLRMDLTKNPPVFCEDV